MYMYSIMHWVQQYYRVVVIILPYMANLNNNLKEKTNFYRQYYPVLELL